MPAGVIDLTQSSDGEARDPAELRTLEQAIRSCPQDALRQSILRLVRNDGAVRRAVYRELVGVVQDAQPPAPKWHKCAQCGETYDATSDDLSCTYHDGDLEVDEEFFADHDEDCHGPMDSSENRREYPEGFRWNCCDKTTHGEGCCEGVHIPKENKRRRLH